MITPDTPVAWLVQRLSEHAPLVALLGGEYFCKAGEGDSAWPVCIVIKEPVAQNVIIVAGKWPQYADGRYFLWAEVRSDRLPAGSASDDVLRPIVAAMLSALLADNDATATTGGLVHGCAVEGFYNPPDAPLSQTVKVAQKGIIARLTFS